MSRIFELEVDEIFYLRDGRVVFAGMTQGTPRVRSGARCRLLFDGEVVGEVTVYPEMFDPAPESPKYAVSVRCDIDLRALSPSSVRLFEIE